MGRRAAADCRVYDRVNSRPRMPLVLQRHSRAINKRRTFSRSIRRRVGAPSFWLGAPLGKYVPAVLEKFDRLVIIKLAAVRNLVQR